MNARRFMDGLASDDRWMPFYSEFPERGHGPW
jgi:hypothetical protein